MRKGESTVLGMPVWLVAILVVVGIWYAVQTGILSVAPVARPPTAPTTITTQGACPSDGQATLKVAAFESVVPTSGVLTQVTNADVYLFASPDGQDFSITPVATFNLSTGEYTGRLCNQYVKMYIGRDQGTAGGYYMVQVPEMPKLISNALVQFSTRLDKIGTVIAEFDNGTAFRQTNLQITVNPGQKNTDLVFNLKENSGAVVHAPAICFDFNGTFFSDVFVPGATKITTPDRLSSTYGKIACYDLGIDKIVNNQRTDKYTVEIDVKSDAPTNTSTTIGYTIIDKGTYIMNGELKEGYEDYNDANVGAPDTTGSITVNIPA